MSRKCTNTYYPLQYKSFTPSGPAFPLLQKGYEVSVNKNGFVVDAWNPRDKVLVNAEGETVGSREDSFQYDDAPEYFEDHKNTFKQEDKDRFRKDSKEYELLDMGLEITLDKHGTLIEIRDPVTKKLLDFELNDIGNLEYVGLPDRYTKVVKNPQRETYTLKDLDEFTEGGDMYHALTISPDMKVTLDDDGFIIDIWDSKTGKLYDIHGGDQGTRSDPYPSDNNIGNLASAIAQINAQMTALRALRAVLPKAARGALTAQIAALSAKRGRLLFQWGRLQHRRRRMNEAYNKKQTKSITKQK